MSDIFVSYVMYDTETAYKLSAVFRQQGWTVWLGSHTIKPGRNDAELDAEELTGAKVVVALWSFEAGVLPTVPEDLKHSGAALPVIVLLDEGASLPEFVPVRPFDLSDWDGAASHAELQQLLRHLRTIIGTRPASLEELSLSKIQENAALGIKESAEARLRDEAQPGGVFISYRRNEAAAYGGRLYDRLAARFGKEKVFIDTENIGWGEDFVEAITAAAESCAVMIALISRQWSRGAGGEAELDDYVRLEVAKALGRKIRVIPILIQGAAMPAPKELPEDLAPLVRRNALALSDTRWERDVEDLIKTLESLIKD